MLFWFLFLQVPEIFLDPTLERIYSPLIYILYSRLISFECLTLHVPAVFYEFAEKFKM